MTAATTIRAGDVVPNRVGLPITITGVRADGVYESAYGGEWIAVADDGEMSLFPYYALPTNGSARPAADVRPVADETGLTFQVDVSRTYRNKDGYEESGLKLNSSFVTETHTVDSFLETVVKPGWPYTMVHAKRTPQETGAAARGVLTPKHTENFTSTQLLTFDDDSRLPGVVDYWKNEPFFGRYGLAFVESVNSQSGVAEKGHPTLLLDRPITDPTLYRECLKAYCYAFPRLDPLTNIDRTIYNAEGARVDLIGAVCPFEAFEQTYLEPYRAMERDKSASIEAERERRRQETERAKAEGRTVSHSLEEAYLAGYLRWLFDHVAAKRAGDNRNKATYWAGRCIAGIEATEWARPYHHLLADVDTRIIAASVANGYLSDHAHDDEREVLRVFDLGRRAGGEPLDAPTPRPLVNGRRPAVDGAAGGQSQGATPQGYAVQPDAAEHGNVLTYRPEDGGIMDVWHDEHGGDWRFATGFEEWHSYTGTHYQPDVGSYALKAQIASLMDGLNWQARTLRAAVPHTDKDELRRLSTYVDATKRTAARVASVEGLARLRCYVSADKLDAADVLNLSNGTLDLSTLTLRPHDRGDLLTYCLPYAYDPAAVAPNWAIVLERIEEETRDFLQEYAGYALTPDTRHELAVWLYGPPGRGASTLLAGWQAMLGAKATLLGLADIERNRFALASLPGKTLAIATEQPADYMAATHILNALISGEPVTVDRKFKDAVTITPRAKLAWAMNELPRVKGASNGIFRRVKVVTFPTIPEHERLPKLKEAVQIEAAGILNWALDGLRRLRARGRFVIPAAVEAASRAFAEQNDIPAAFVNDRCEVGPGFSVGSQELYNAYHNWCLETGHKPQSLTTIADDWGRLGFQKVKTTPGMVWHGLKLDP